MNDQRLKAFIEQSLAEDIGPGDHTSLACIEPGNRLTAQLLVKDVGVIAGVEVARRIFEHVDPAADFNLRASDGDDVTMGQVVFEVTCKARALLGAERLVLNVMQRMSAIATLSSRFAVEVEGLDVKVLDTRKTTPLIRFLEKEAVRIGGCYNYREGLYDWIMIKDNHVDACGGVREALERVHAYLEANDLDLGITVEVRNLVELYELLRCDGFTRIMLDNFDLPILEEAVRIIDGRFEVEASGGINLRNVRIVAETGVDYISVGALTHSAGSLDLSLKVI